MIDSARPLAKMPASRLNGHSALGRPIQRLLGFTGKYSPLSGEVTMRSTRVQIWIILALGGFIGYIAACSQNAPSHNAGAVPPTSGNSARPAPKETPTGGTEATRPLEFAQARMRRPLSIRPAQRLRPTARNRTSSSSWVTTWAGSTSAPTTAASCRERRRISTGWPAKA